MTSATMAHACGRTPSNADDGDFTLWARDFRAMKQFTWKALKNLQVDDIAIQKYAKKEIIENDKWTSIVWLNVMVVHPGATFRGGTKKIMREQIFKVLFGDVKEVGVALCDRFSFTMGQSK